MDRPFELAYSLIGLVRKIIQLIFLVLWRSVLGRIDFQHIPPRGAAL
jgi:hypothetical protein